MCAFILMFMFMVFPGPSSTNSDNIALLTGTLKTMQRAACDDEMVSLSCPRGTSISIQVAQYGKAAAHSHTCIPQPNTRKLDTEEKCLWPNAMQYSLLQTVVEACQKKPQCKFSTKSKATVADPCPLSRKFVEVAYKCRPYEFRSRTGCVDEVIKLSCNPHSRIAVFDAQYGRTAFESISCPQTQGIHDETCTAPHAVETVMQICHGKRRCQIVANNKTFSSPCSPDTTAYLKVIYACGFYKQFLKVKLRHYFGNPYDEQTREKKQQETYGENTFCSQLQIPLGVLTERYESAIERDEMVDGGEYEEDEDHFDESDGAGEKWGEPNAASPIANNALPPDLEETNVPAPAKKESSTTLETKKNKEPHEDTLQSRNNLFLYIGISIAIIIICIAVIATRYYLLKRNTRSSKNGDMFTTEAPNVFNDAVSDIDTDVDVSHISGTFYDTDHPDMILYRDGIGKGTLRAMRPLSTIYPCAGASMYGNVDYVPSQSRDQAPRFTRNKDDPEIMMGPKSLSGYSNSQFYYG